MKTALVVSLAAAGLALAYAIQQKRRADYLAAAAQPGAVTRTAQGLVDEVGLGYALNAFGFSY